MFVLVFDSALSDCDPLLTQRRADQCHAAFPPISFVPSSQKTYRPPPLTPPQPRQHPTPSRSAPSSTSSTWPAHQKGADPMFSTRLGTPKPPLTLSARFQFLVTKSPRSRRISNFNHTSSRRRFFAQPLVYPTTSRLIPPHPVFPISLVGQQPANQVVFASRRSPMRHGEPLRSNPS